jgi:hypothetical protein
MEDSQKVQTGLEASFAVQRYKSKSIHDSGIAMQKLYELLSLTILLPSQLVALPE